jgi:cytochrome c oxidase cbb3-type subunit 1
MSVLWAVLAAHVYWRWRRPDGARVWPQAVFLSAMGFVPAVLYWSAGREVFPEVNPGTGGATGASLLGSTLGVVAIFGLLPVMLGLKRTVDAEPCLSARWFWSAYVATCGVFMAMDRGNASHHAPNQWAGLAALLGWVPLAWFYFRGFAWRAAARPWLGAAFVWWALLVVTGLVTFLPGFSERLKFTNGLVGHAHLAMAGLMTSLNLVILESFGGTHAPPLTRRADFWLWQSACAVMVATLITLGAFERDRAGELFRAEAWTEAFYAVRLGAGAAMTFASVRWLRRTFL